MERPATSRTGHPPDTTETTWNLLMAQESITVTRERAIELINVSLENLSLVFEGAYYRRRPTFIYNKLLELDREMVEVITTVRSDHGYQKDLKTISLKELEEFLLMCREMGNSTAYIV